MRADQAEEQQKRLIRYLRFKVTRALIIQSIMKTDL